MLEFIVLGYVPGTKIQISFALWFSVTVLIATLFLLYIARKKRLASRVVVTITLLWIWVRLVRGRASTARSE